MIKTPAMIICRLLEGKTTLKCIVISPHLRYFLRNCFARFSTIFVGVNAKMIESQLTSHVYPEKIRYHHILHDVQVLIECARDDSMKDFYQIHSYLTQYYGVSEEFLLLQGLRRAYRQIVEGV